MYRGHGTQDKTYQSTGSITDTYSPSLIFSGVATGVARGESATPDYEKIAKNLEKSGKIGKNLEISGKKSKNREEKAKIGKFLSLCPS